MLYPVSEGRPYRTVVVDDVAEVVDLVTRILDGSSDFEIVGSANDGVEAVAKVAASQPDLVLMDLDMPRMSGDEALGSLLEVAPSTRVVILSAHTPDERPEITTESGIAGWLQKDLPVSVMLDRLYAIMQEPLPRRVSPDLDAPPAPKVAPLLTLSAEEMVSLVAHEVRNHLSVIHGFGSEIYQRWDAIPDVVRKDSVLRMTERARYLNTVVNNLMFMRRLDSGHLWSEPAEHEIGGLLRSFEEELAELAGDRDLRMSVYEALPLVRIDSIRLRQVLTNLVVNADRYSPEGSTIHIDAYPDDSSVLLAVADEGHGIDPSHADVIFERFGRLATGGSGIGLGLFISRALMRSMDGDLWLGEPTHGGATFICRLPVL